MASVRGDVAQHPGASRQVEMRVAMEIEVCEMQNRLGCAAGRKLAGPNEAPQRLCHLGIDQVRRVELGVVPKESRLHSSAERGLQEELQQCGGIDDNHADSRSWRITAAAVSSASHAPSHAAESACLPARTGGEPFEFAQQVVGERLAAFRRPHFERAMQPVRHVPDLNHLRHVISMRTC